MEDLVGRAITAWFRSGADDQPSNTSWVETYGGRNYVVLENVSGVLAVYRVRPDGRLRRMLRAPAALMK